MKTTQLFRLCLQNIRRGKRGFALSIAGIVVGISVMVFLIALAFGVKQRVIHKAFPPGRLEVVSPSVILDLGPPHRIDQNIIDKLQKHPDVEAVYPRMKIAFPIVAWPGKDLQKYVKTIRSIQFSDKQIVIDGVDPDSMPDLTESKENPFDLYKKKRRLPFQDLSQAGGGYCETDEGIRAEVANTDPDAPAAIAPPVQSPHSCPAPMYCEWNEHRCKMPIPVLASPLMIETYNAFMSSTSHGSQLGSLAGQIPVSQFFGITLDGRLNKDVQDPGAGPDLPVRFMLVGVSEDATRMGFTVPLAYVRQWNDRFVGNAGSKQYSSASVVVRSDGNLSAVVAEIKNLGYDINDNGAEKIGFAILLITGIFLLVSLAIILVTMVNIGHIFIRIVLERRRELGVMRAVGATSRDLKLLILAEASAMGIVGGSVGLVLAWGLSGVVDVLAQRLIPYFPFKPDSFFLFSPWLCVGALGLSVLACTVGAYWPARGAAKLSPSEVLSSV